MHPSLKVGLGLLVAGALAAGGFALLRIHESNVAARSANLARLESAQAVTTGAGHQLTDEVAEYSSAHASRAISRARALNESIASDLRTIAQAYGTIYGDAAILALRTESTIAHDACARSLDEAVRGDAKASDRDDALCGQHGMNAGVELGKLGSRLDADVAAAKASLSAL